jgi:hypothetical protein
VSQPNVADLNGELTYCCRTKPGPVAAALDSVTKLLSLKRTESLTVIGQRIMNFIFGDVNKEHSVAQLLLKYRRSETHNCRCWLNGQSHEIFDLLVFS